MAKIFLGLAAGALLIVLALPGPAGAAERRADGIRSNSDIEQTEFSSRHRRWHRHRYYVRRYHRPYYGYPYYGWGHPYGYYRPGPAIGLSFGFGPRFWW
jgi:hypothetical protein